jgi:5,10-methylenetetrahydromethanopterin reductase
MSTEFWTSAVAAPRRASQAAAEAETAGWHGLTTVDSQNLSGDPYLFLGLASTSTSRLRLMTSVTNPVTRHPAVTASSALSVQHLSAGRFELGIGRGDSALAHLGRAPARLRWFEQYLRNVHAYVHGEEVPFEDAAVSDDISPPVEGLGLADRPTTSSMQWARSVDPVPIAVAATGPRVIAIAARHADRIMFAVGAEPERVQWGINTANQAAEEAGRNPAELSFGAYVNVVCDGDVAWARTVGMGSASLFARFSVMHGTVNGPADDDQRQVFNNLHERYDMNHHARGTGAQTTALTDEFLDRFAIIGGTEHCIDRLGALVDLGVSRFLVTGAQSGARDVRVHDAGLRFSNEVIPALSTT